MVNIPPALVQKNIIGVVVLAMPAAAVINTLVQGLTNLVVMVRIAVDIIHNVIVHHPIHGAVGLVLVTALMLILALALATPEAPVLPAAANI